MTTAQDLIYEAYGLSRKNTPGDIADEVGELIPQLNRSLRRYFALGARINPEFFGKNTSVPFAGGAWRWPREDGPSHRILAASIQRIVAGAGVLRADGSGIAAGVQITEVPFNQPWANSMLPSVYHYGQNYFPAGNPADPVNGTLVFMHARIPNALVAMFSVVEPAWPEQHNSLLTLELGIYLARKDGNREDEVGALTAERDAELAAYQAFLEHATTAEARAYGAPAKSVTPATQVVP